MKPDQPDVFSWVLENYESNPKTTATEQNLIGDAYLIVVAGRYASLADDCNRTLTTTSDTTAATLTCLFLELATHVTELNKLQLEIDEYFKGVEQLDNASLSKLPYLEAVINEGLRLHPAVPSGLQRQTPPEGLQVGDVFIPGNTIVQVPLHTLFRGMFTFTL